MKRALPLAFLCAVFCAPAAAQQPGVTYDPDSPAGKQYAIPLTAARNEASGGTTDPSPSSAGASASPASDGALFGEGVTAKSASSTGSAGAHTGKAQGTAAGHGAGSRQQQDSGANAPSAASRTRIQAILADSSTGQPFSLQMAVLAAALAFAAGLGMRRRGHS